MALIGLIIITFSCNKTQEQTAFPEDVVKQLEDLYDEDQMMALHCDVAADACSNARLGFWVTMRQAVM